MLKKSNYKNQHIVQLLLSIVIVVLLFYISTRIFFRIDLTSEKRYTLSSQTKEILSGLDDMVYVKVYLEGDMPYGFKKLRNSIQDMLNEFRMYGGNNLQYEFINPSESQDMAINKRVFNDLYQKGLKPYEAIKSQKDGGVSKNVLFPGVIISYGTNEIAVNLLKKTAGLSPEKNLTNTEQDLEYELVKAIYYVTKNRVDRIGFLEGHGELDTLQSYIITRELENDYLVQRVKIENNPSALEPFRVVVIAKPSMPFSEKDKLVIDQYIMNGGKVVWLLDGVNVNFDSLSIDGTTFAYPNSLNLDDQLFSYGVRVNSDLLLEYDQNYCAKLPYNAGEIEKQAQWVLAPWRYFPLISPMVQHSVTRNLYYILGQFVSSIDTVGYNSEVNKTVLLTSSANTKKLKTPAFISLKELTASPNAAEFNNSHLPIAVLLEGNFKSVFRNRDAAHIMSNWNKETKPLGDFTKMIVISDGDLIANAVRYSNKGPVLSAMGLDKYSQKVYSNKEFIINAINYLTGEDGLNELRNKEFKVRLLNREKIKEEKFKWQFINTVVPVCVVLLFGFYYNQNRKKRYSK